jgi:hypothetical protein
MKSGLGLMAAGALALAAMLTGACGQSSGAASSGAAAPDPSNASFKIEKQTITLANGRSERPSAPGSASAAVTILDQKTTGDVDGDGRADSVVILVDQPGGSGSFSYVAALLNPSAGATATDAVMLGDRIKISSVRVDGRTIVVDILDRAPGQPMTASPGVAVTKRFVVDGGALKPQ